MFNRVLYWKELEMHDKPLRKSEGEKGDPVTGPLENFSF
ncbi:hypothetical protein NitYY0814_C0405 [Nitratiruptor sp. YY08-14]|nr:hypothetical protein NitYY0810_C0405 [Nitratiruptor sp. YY08-10]BCD63577.1 hypothetical protein NitYY0814_C0405 [Nitratiruptor sp. YY08-14]